MAEVTVEVRNGANTSGTEIAAAFDVKWQEQRNGVGRGEFSLENTATEHVAEGDVILGRLHGAPRFAFIAERSQPTMVSKSDEMVEATTWSGRGILAEWADSRLHDTPTLSNMAQLVPVLDERVMAWFGPDFDETGGGWTGSKVIAVQGWASPFYTGLPAEWRDPSALWIGPHSGDASNAPEGRNLFRRWFLIGVGAFALDFAGDNIARAWVNGQRCGSDADFRRKQTYDFEVTAAGWICVAFELTNFADDGPAGGNPTALLWSVIDATGGVVAHSDTTTQLLAYPSADPEVPIGRQIRQVMSGNTLLDGWTVAGTATTDSNGVPFPPTGPMSYRLGKDSPWDVVSQLAQVHIDVTVDAVGRTLHPFVKGTAGAVSSLTLTTGYSAAGVADPNLVNVDDLSWDLPRPDFDALVVRFSRGRFTRGSGHRWSDLDLGHIDDPGTAAMIADGLLALAADETGGASLTVLNPVTVPTPHDTLLVPGPDSHDVSTPQSVSAVTITGDMDGDAEVTIAVGSLVADRITRLEAASRRTNVAGALGGAAAAAVAPVVAPSRSTAAAGGLECLFSTARDVTAGTSSRSGHPSAVGTVNEFLLESETTGSSSTSIRIAVNGTVKTTLTLPAAAKRVSALAGFSWTPADTVTLTPTADGGHQGLAVFAATSRMR